MTLSESSSVASASAAPPNTSTEFSRPRRPRRRCSMTRSSLSFPGYLLVLFPIDEQRNHPERPYLEAHGAVAYLDRPLRFFEEVGALHALDGVCETQGAFPTGAVRFVEAQDLTPPVLGRLEG